MNERDYAASAHRIQTGTKFVEEARVSRGMPAQDALDCRIGLNITMSEFGAICGLLVEKGIVTREELFATLIKGHDQEAARMEEELRSLHDLSPDQKIVLV